jgi:Ribosomal proteins 50S-L15, 50S-L18e, 60S-L27A
MRFGFEGGQNPLVRALSRVRGFNNRFRVDYEAVNVGDLAKLPAGSVTTESLRAAGIVKSARRPVKILGDGEIAVALHVEVEKISAGAKAKIEAAGGTATMLVPAKEKKIRYQNDRAAPSVEEEAPATAASETPAAAVMTETPAAETEVDAKPARRARAPRAKAVQAEDSESSEDSSDSESTEG